VDAQTWQQQHFFEVLIHVVCSFDVLSAENLCGGMVPDETSCIHPLSDMFNPWRSIPVDRQRWRNVLQLFFHASALLHHLVGAAAVAPQVLVAVAYTT